MNKTAALLLVLALLTAPCLVMPLPVRASSKTLIVPDDYPTLSLAIQNAEAGDTVFVKRGNYHEEVININKSLSLVGEGINETILSLNPPLVETWILYNLLWVPDTAIKINANDVKIQGFTINLPKEGLGVVSGICSWR